MREEAKFDIRPVACDGEPDAHSLWMVIGNQSFQISGGLGFESREEAQWMADQLAHALSRLCEEPNV